MIDALYAYLQAQADNSFFAGGLALGAIGVAGGIAARIAYVLVGLIGRRLTVSIVVYSKSEAYEYLLDWFNDHRYTSICRRIQLDVKRSGKHGSRPCTPMIRWTPAPGRHVFFHNGVPLTVQRSRGGGGDTGEEPLHKGIKESIHLTAMTPRKNFLTDLAAEIVDRYGRNDNDRLRVYTPDGYGDWDLTHRIRKRPITTIVTANNVAGKILEDARCFLDREEFYVRRGLPWRRGYLLYGPPGTGKTSLIRGIASELDLELAILSLTDRNLTDSGLITLLSNAPERAVLVLEDVDALYVERESVNHSTGISFSGLLNAIDGPASQEGRMLFMTTNHRDRLDPALIRPGRVDMQVELGHCGPDELQKLYLNVFPGDERGANHFKEKFRGSDLSPADAQRELVELTPFHHVQS